MNYLALVFRSLSKKRQSHLIKILSLGTGLAVGLILISKVFFEQSYDHFYPDSDRIYQIQSSYQQGNEPPGSYGQVSGAIAPGMKAEVPGVEKATRLTYLGSESVFFTPDKKRYSGTFIMADSCLFDVLPRPMIEGSAKDVLSRPMYVLVSGSIAKKMGGDVVGKSIQLDRYPGKTLVVGGVFEDVPENTHLKYDVVLSLSSMKSFFSWDGSMNWMGNDRYLGYVKLVPHTDPNSLGDAIYRMQKRNQDLDGIEKAGAKLSYSLLPLTKLHSDTAETRRMTLLLSLLAVALIFTAVMNYVLIVIATLAGRAKSIAVYKCHGATGSDVTKLVFAETSVHLLISLALSVLLIIVFRGTVEEITASSIASLFSPRTCLLLLAVCLLVALLTGVIPAYLFSKIPVATVFRQLKKSGRGWKLALLFIQFAASAFLVSLLVVVARQYDVMVNDRPGYAYERLLYCGTAGVDNVQRQKAIDELTKLPQVEMVATSSTLPFAGASGNNVYLPDDDRELFNVADLYWADDHYLPLMEIPVVQGKGFDRETSTGRDLLVSQSFADKMVLLAGWTDGAVGKNVIITEHQDQGPCNIVGVYPDFRLGSISDQDMRPSVIFYTATPASTLLVKLGRLQSEHIQTVYDVLKASMPEKDIVLTPYQDSMVKLYADSRLFRNSVMIGGLVTLMMALIGLIGYGNNEINRRSKEIAIRKISGGSLMAIIRLFLRDTLWVAVPAMITGGVAAAIMAMKWMENFSEKAELSLVLFGTCGSAVLAVIVSVVFVNCLRIANQNPIEAVKTE